MSTYLHLTDGTTDLNLNNPGTSSGYELQYSTWAPGIAEELLSPLGGRGAFGDVEERITLVVRGTSYADALANLDALRKLAGKATRWWWRGESVSPVTLKYSPNGATVSSSSAPLRALILGQVGPGMPVVHVTPAVHMINGVYVIPGVELHVLRRGAWVCASDSTGASGSAANATVLTQTFSPSHPLSSFLSVEIGGFNKTATPTIKAGFLCVGSQSSDIQVVEAESGTAASYTSVADAANLARGGSVLRFTPAVTTAVTSGAISLTATGGAPVAVIAAVRNNSATTSFLLHANLSGVVAVGSTPDILIDTSSVQPRLMLLGTVVGNALTSLTLTATASAASGTLDIDFLIVVNLRDETVAIVANDDINLANLSTSGAATLFMGFNPTSDRVPQVYSGGTAGLAPATYRGALPFMTVDANVYALWTATNGQYWRFTNTSNAIVNVTLNCGRDRSYLTPQ